MIFVVYTVSKNFLSLSLSGVNQMYLYHRNQLSNSNLSSLDVISWRHEVFFFFLGCLDTLQSSHDMLSTKNNGIDVIQATSNGNGTPFSPNYF